MASEFIPSDDPTTPPHPEGGWSCAIRVVKGALVSHVFQGHLVHPSGVHDAQGAYVHEAVHWRGRPLMTPPPMPEAPEPLAGRWLYGGVLKVHFGHFIMESLGRLWALEREKVDGILYIPEDVTEENIPDELASWQKRLLGLYGIDLPVRILKRPLQVEELVVPGPGFSIGPLSVGTEPFRSFTHRRFAADIAPEGAPRIYLSRSRLELGAGGVTHEDQLEADLVAQGYHSYHPQEHGLEAQIAQFKAATHVVSLDGSALHFFALVARPDQQVAMIRRRPGWAARSMAVQLRGFAGGAPLFIEALRRNWVRSDRPEAFNVSYGELEFHRVGKALAAQGFIDAPEAITRHSPKEAAAYIAALERRIGNPKLHYAPVGPDGKPMDPDAVPARRKARLAAKGRA